LFNHAKPGLLSVVKPCDQLIPQEQQCGEYGELGARDRGLKWDRAGDATPALCKLSLFLRRIQVLRVPA